MRIQLISRAPATNSRVHTPFLVDGIQTIGGINGEPFAIRVINDLNERVEVILAVDGTNVITGEKATIDDSKRWVIAPRSNLSLEAWPETSEGGGQFVFVSEDGDMVATHTHGQLFAKGYISAAFFVESWQPPRYPQPDEAFFNEAFSGRGGDVMRGRGGQRYGSRVSGYESATRGAPASLGMSENLGTGVGSYVQQAIGTTAGHMRPALKDTVTLRYVNWPALEARLRAEGGGHPTGFEHRGRPMANLRSTPRQLTLVPAVITRFVA